MKALRKFEPGAAKFRVEEVEDPKPGPGEVTVEIAYAGICGTDMHIYHGTYNDAPPMTLGHEFSGTIAALGEGVTGFAVGDLVVAETNAEFCGECVLCRAGRFCLCDSRKAIGQQVDGVFADRAVIPARELFKLPPGVSMLGASLSEPLSCVVHGIMERSRIKAGDTVLVSGPGPIGLMAVMVAKLSGARVILSGTTADEARLALGLELGADLTVDVMTRDLEAEIEAFTGKKNVDVVLECSGVGAAVSAGIAVLKKTGIFTQIGLFGKSVSLNLDALCFKEIDYHGCLSKTDWSWRRTMDILGSKKLNLEKLVSHRFSLDEWDRAFSIGDNKQGMKIVFEPKKIYPLV